MIATPQIYAAPMRGLPRGLLCFLHNGVQGDQHAIMKSEKYSSLPIARKGRPHLPQAAAQWTAKRQPHRPAVLNFGDVAADVPLILAR